MERVCADCGRTIPAGTPAGLCMACVFASAQSEQHKASGLPPVENRTIGKFELIRELGRGGMGVVYEARQKDLNRIVALKLILSGGFASETSVARFREEAEIIGALAHPNIVPLYETGEEEGRHFFSMQLIEGKNLATLLKGKSRPTRADLRDIAQQFVKIARAIHFAHQRGIIHRDLSPENVLIDKHGEPWISDFGMARLVTSDRQLTQTNTVLGKPDYLSPEQADPNGPYATTSSDIFSLGTMLYETIAGTRPFAAATPLATLNRIRNEEPMGPSRLNPAINRDLETICLRCLSKDAGSRYASAAALADDLERWMRREPILARHVGPGEQCWKWIRRRPLHTAAATLALLAIAGPIITSFYLYYFVLPIQARTHPVIGRDRSINGYMLTIETGKVDRVSLNFDLQEFKLRDRLVVLYFTNCPPAAHSYLTNLKCRIAADIPGAPDPAKSQIVHPGESFKVQKAGKLERAFYVMPDGWQGQAILAKAPYAQICISLVDGE